MLDVYTFLYIWDYQRTELLNWVVNRFYSQCSEPWFLTGPKYQRAGLQQRWFMLRVPCDCSAASLAVTKPPTRSHRPAPAAFCSNSQHTAIPSWLMETERLAAPSFLNGILHLRWQTAFICCLKYLNQNFSLHGNTKNVNSHYTEINATKFTLLNRDTERQKHLFLLQLIKAPPQLRSKHDLDCLLWPTRT